MANRALLSVDHRRSRARNGTCTPTGKLAVNTSRSSSKPLLASIYRRRRRRRQPSAEGSLYHLLSQHPHTPLFVRPLRWTDAHASLLGAKFVNLPPCDTPKPHHFPGSPPSRGHLQPSEAVSSLSKALSDVLASTQDGVKRLTAVEKALSILWPAALSFSQRLENLHIFLGNRNYRDVARAPMTWFYEGNCARLSPGRSRSESATGSRSSDFPPGSDTANAPRRGPIVCFIDKSWLTSLRERRFQNVKGAKNKNDLHPRPRRLRSIAWPPAKSDHDPYVVAVLLVMAQSHFYQAPSDAPRSRVGWSIPYDEPQRSELKDIKLKVMTHDSDLEVFTIYTGHVTTGFLERFDSPSETPAHAVGDSVGMQIEYTTVPIWPILGLRERLGTALGNEVVGDFDATRMETWED